MYIYLIDLFTCYFKFRLAHRLRHAPCGASYTVHSDSFTAHNNNNDNICSACVSYRNAQLHITMIGCNDKIIVELRF